MFYKKAALKNFAISIGNTCVGDLKACNLLKKRPQHRCFSVNIAKFLRLPFLKKICERLHFYCFNGSLLHRSKVSRFRLYDNARLQGPSHRSSFFVFKSASLILNRILTCCKTNTFDESSNCFICYFWLF